jgi:thymidine kinase
MRRSSLMMNYQVYYGLDIDYMGKPFGIMPELLAVADFVTKLNAICVRCGAQAIHSYRKTQDADLVMLGEKDIYEPRCRNCFKLEA